MSRRPSPKTTERLVHQMLALWDQREVIDRHVLDIQQELYDDHQANLSMEQVVLLSCSLAFSQAMRAIKPSGKASHAPQWHETQGGRQRGVLRLVQSKSSVEARKAPDGSQDRGDHQ
jgi:hypothetical protein